MNNTQPSVSSALRGFSLLALILAGLFAYPSPALARSQYYWDATNPIDASPGSGGTGNWNTTAGNTVWWVSGGSDSIWANGNIANFAGTAGTVTVNTAVTANGLTFATSGYTIGGTSNLTLATATVTLPDSGTETINCPLAGTTTVTVSTTTSGPSTLILGGTNTYTGATSISSGATLTIAGAGSLNNGSYAGAITDNGTFIYNSSAAQTLSGTITGTGTLTQQGSGTLTLTHANTGFTGGTTINSGATLALTAVAGAGTSTTITNNGTLNLTAGGAANYDFTVTGGSSSIINLTIAYSTGSENLRFPGPGTLSGFGGTINLIALNSTGGTNGGTFGTGQLIMSIQASTLTSPGTWNIYAGATLDFASPLTTSSANVIINGPGNSQPYGALRIDSVNQTGNVTLNGTGITIGDNASAGAAPSQISGNISDNNQGFGFSKVAPRTIILSGANTYTGPTIISAGALQVDSTEIPGTSGPLGKSSTNNPGNIVLSGGTLQYSSVNSNDYSGRFSTSASQNYNIDVNGQSLTFATPLTSSGGELTLLDTAGGGTLTLSGTNTYNGITTISSGTLNISGSVAGTVITANGGTLELSSPTALPLGAIITLPSSPADGMVNLNFTGTQNITTLNYGSSPMPSGTYGALNNNSVTYPNAAFTGNGILNVQPPTYWDPGFSNASPGSGGNGSWDSSSTNWFIGSSDTKWASNNVASFAGTAGTVTLNANETADGLTFTTSGYVITNTNGVSVLTLAGTPIITVPGGTAEIDCTLAGTAGLTESGSGTLTLGGANTYTGPTAIASGCSLVLSRANAYTGATTIGSGATLTITGSGNLAGGSYPGNIANSGGALVYNSSVSQVLSGIISGSGTLTQDGPGLLTLSGLNTFTGGITISGGTLTIGGSGDLGNNITFNTGSYAGSIDDAGAFIYNSSTAQTLTGAIYDTGMLTQEGPGTLTLSGFNTYEGATVITKGTLALSGSGSINNSISMSIAAGAIFDVSALSSPYTLSSTTNLIALGTTNAAATIKGASGSIVDLGAQPISLTITPRTFNGDATNQALTISQGALNLNGNVITVTNAGSSALGAGTYTLIHVSGGTINGTPSADVSSVGGAGLAANTTASISVTGGDVDLVVSSTAVPVPVINSVVLTGAGLVLSGTNGPIGGTYSILTSTNLALPLSSWTTNATGTFSLTGTFSVTNTVGVSPSFFVVRVP
jgi:autotransporter-associated beta strand protein